MKITLDWPDTVPLNINVEFLQDMCNRMAVAYYKYGPAMRKENADKGDHLASARLRVQKYLDTGNTEFLMDAANSLMIEFTHPAREGAFFRATDSRESPGIVTAATGAVVHGKIEDEDWQQP